MSSHLHYSQHQHQHQHNNSYHPHAPSHLSRSHSLPLSNGSGSGSGSSAPESIAQSLSHNPLLANSSLSHITNPLSNPHSSQMHAFPDTAIPPTPAPERASEASSAWQTSLQMRVMQQLDKQLQEAHANYQKQLAGFHQAQQAQLAGLQGLVAQQQQQAQQGQQEGQAQQQQKAVGSPLLRTQSPPSSFAPFHVPVTPMPGAGVPNTPLPSLLPLMSPNLTSLPLASSTPANALSGMDLLRLQSPAALLYQLELQYNATIQQLQMHAASTLQAELEREALARSQLGGGFNGEGVRATLKGAGVVDDNDDDEDESEGSGEEGSDGDSEDNEESDDESVNGLESKMGGMRLSGAQKGKGRAVEGDQARGEGQRGGVDDQLDMLNEIYRRNQARLAHVAASTPSPAPYQHSPSHSPPLDGEQEEVGGESGYESSGVMSEGGEGGFDTDREDTSRAVRRARAPSIDLKDVDPDEADIRTALRLRTSYLNLPLVPLSSNPNGGFSEDSFERLQAQLRAENQKRIQDEFRRRAEGIRERKKKDKEDGVLSDTSVSEAVSEGGALTKKDAGKDKGKEYPLSDSDVRQTRALVRSGSPAYTSRSPSISTSTSHSSRAASPAPFAYPTTKTPYAPSYASHHSYAGYGGYTSSYGGYGTYGSGGYAGGGSAPGYASASSASSASGVSTPSTSVYGGSAHSSPAKPQFKTFSALGTSSSSASASTTTSSSTTSTTTTSTGTTSSPFYTLHPKNQHSLHIHSQSASASTTSSNASSAATSPVGTTFKGLPFGGGMLLSSGNASGGGTQATGTPKKSGQERWLPPGVRR